MNKQITLFSSKRAFKLVVVGKKRKMIDEQTIF